MIRRLLLCVPLLSAALATSNPVVATTVVEQAATAAQRDLQASLQQLSTLRETIAAEKIPLSRELSQLEERLTELRRDFDSASRLLDTRNLELSNLKAELKQRQDEATYLGNLLDEYARGFDSRVHPAEIERFAPLIEAARLAPQNADLTLREKFDRQLALVKASLARLDELIGGVRFPGTAVDVDGTVAQGQFALIGPVALFAAPHGSAGLALPQAGSNKAAVRPLDKKLNWSLASVVNKGEGLIPLDPTRGSALKELINRGSLVGYFKKGGPIMWPLLFVSLLAVTVVVERLYFLSTVRRERDPKAVEGIFSRLEQGDIEGAIKIGKGTKDFVGRAMTYALMHREKSLSDAILRASNQELVRFNRAIPLLDTIVTMAPLLGLLGTVTGMMSSFGMLGGAELSSPAVITGGIAEALIATCCGLAIAIAALIPLNYLRTKADAARHELEDASSNLELLLKPILEAEQYRAGKRLAERVASRARELTLEERPGGPDGGAAVDRKP